MKEVCIQLDDMHCVVCGGDVFSVDVESYSIVRWNPETQSNELVSVYCGNHQPHYYRALDKNLSAQRGE